jgi:hypothetical protein
MKPGHLVRNRWEGTYLPMYKKPHGIMVHEYLTSELGIVLDSCYSSSDVPYVQILVSCGKIGWIRYEHVEVIK